MYPNRNPYPYYAPQAAEARPLAEALPFIRRVYSLFAGGIAFTIAGALLALFAGEPTRIPVGIGEAVEVPPLVVFFSEHWIIGIVLYFGAFLAASFLRRKPGVNVAALFGYTFITGLFIAPALFFAQLQAKLYSTVTGSPVLHAFLLTGAAFAGLTAYAFISRKNFSFLGAALNMGAWVLIGAIVLSIFVHAQVLYLAIASVGVLLFSGYILFNTSRLIHDRSEDDAVGAALRLFLSVINVFMFLLQILSSRRD
jgi:modulator of FtsH protease